MKAIFFDIDGTLVSNGTYRMEQSTIDAIGKARANGHICMINTGRSKSLVGEELKSQVEFDGFLYGCGTEIEYHNQILMHKTFTPEQSVRIMNGIKKYGIDAILEGEENNYADEPDTFHTDTFRNYITKFDGLCHGKWSDGIGKFDKFFCYVDEVSRIEAFKREFDDILDFVDREHGFYEVLPKGFSKATAIKYVEDKLGIKHEDTVAIGDSSNDLPMLEYAHTAIGMGNSSQIVLDMADFISTECGKDGIWNALDWLGVMQK